MQERLRRIGPKGVGRLSREPERVSPLLLIGLGGSGKEVLMRVRRRMVENYLSLDNVPFAKFIYLDTDMTSKTEKQGDMGDDDHLISRIRLSPAEKVELAIQGNLDPILKTLPDKPHLDEWFDGAEALSHFNIQEGAGQERMASRLCFFQSGVFNDFCSKLRTAERKLSAPTMESEAAEAGFSLDGGKLTVYVIGSLAGGTGSGIFLDVGFLLKKLLPGANTVGFFLLPNLFMEYAGRDRMMANGYAALQELHHYSLVHPFNVSWDGATREALGPPPFNWVYLLGGKNENGVTVGNEEEIYSVYQMIAESIFQDCSKDLFAGHKRSVRVNLVQYMKMLDIDDFWNRFQPVERDETWMVAGDTFSTNFGSMGMTVLSFPGNHLRTAAACRLTKAVLEHWEKAMVDNPLEALFTSFLRKPKVELVQGRFAPGGYKEEINATQLEDRLLAYDQESGESFLDHLASMVSRLKNELEAAPWGEKARVLDEHLAQFDVRLQHEESTHAAEMGMDVEKIHRNYLRIRRELEEGVREEAGRLAKDERYGVAYTLSMLQALKTLLHRRDYRYIPVLEEELDAHVHDIPAYRDILEMKREHLRRHENQFLFRKADVARDLEVLLGEKGETGTVYSYWYCRVMRLVFKKALDICRHLDEEILGEDQVRGRGLLGDYHKLMENFREIRRGLDSWETYYQHPKGYVHHHYLEVPQMLDRLYEQWLGQDQELEENVHRAGQRLLTEVFSAESVTGALNEIQKNAMETILNRLVLFCRDHVLEGGKTPSALDVLWDTEMFSEGERRDLVERMCRRAGFWLSRNLEGRAEEPSLQQRVWFVGLHGQQGGVDHPQLRSFKALVENSGAKEVVFLPLDESNKGDIVFYTEVAGLPVFYPQVLDHMQAEYKKQGPGASREKKRGPVHTDKRWYRFVEMIPKTREEAARYRHVLTVFMQAKLLGVLRVDVSGGVNKTVYYSYYVEKPARSYYERLGDEYTAMFTLYHDQAPQSRRKIDYLEDLVREALDLLQARDLLAVYRLLIDFYRTQVYPPKKDELTESGQTFLKLAVHSHEWAALDHCWFELKTQRLSEPGQLARLEQALIALTGRSLKEQTRMKYEDYMAALRPYCVKAGYFEDGIRDTHGQIRTIRKDLWALALEGLKSGRDATGEKGGEPGEDASSIPPVSERPCPRCKKPIPASAVYCRHEGVRVAHHRTCARCQETKVPDDLANCWHCGAPMPSQVRTVTCASCGLPAPAGGVCGNCGARLDLDGKLNADPPPASGPGGGRGGEGSGGFDPYTWPDADQAAEGREANGGAGGESGWDSPGEEPEQREPGANAGLGAEPAPEEAPDGAREEAGHE